MLTLNKKDLASTLRGTPLRSCDHSRLVLAGWGQQLIIQGRGVGQHFKVGARWPNPPNLTSSPFYPRPWTICPVDKLTPAKTWSVREENTLLT